MDEVPVLGDDAGRRRPGVVRPEGGADVGMFSEQGGHARQRIRMDHAVRIDEHDDVTTRHLESAVPGVCRTVRFARERDHRVSVARGNQRRFVATPVVDNHQLPAVAWEIRVPERAERTRQDTGSVVRRHDDGEEGPAAHWPLPRASTSRTRRPWARTHSRRRKVSVPQASSVPGLRKYEASRRGRSALSSSRPRALSLVVTLS